MATLIWVLVAIVIFAILAGGMKYVCDTFFSGIRAAYWICGVVLLILLLLAANAFFNGGIGELHFPR